MSEAISLSEFANILSALIFSSAAVVAAAIACISGFGIGSILTPIFSLAVGMKLAVALVSIPHLVATAERFWMLRKELNVEVLRSFGIYSAAGGLLGALFQEALSNSALVAFFCLLLIFVGAGGLTGLTAGMRIPARLAWLAGLASGLFGGLVGNQGGIRSAALLAFPLEKAEFVATATAVGVIVDLARIPVYLVRYGADILHLWWAVLLCAAACSTGTYLGTSVLSRIPPEVFRRLVCLLILLLGIFMAWRTGL